MQRIIMSWLAALGLGRRPLAAHLPCNRLVQSSRAAVAVKRPALCRWAAWQSVRTVTTAPPGGLHCRAPAAAEPAEPAPFLSKRRIRAIPGMPHALVKQLDEVGIWRATHIQSQALPIVMDGEDAIITAETGSGKTLCYVIPFLAARARWLRSGGDGSRPVLLCVLPNQELCNQVSDVISTVDEDARVVVLHGSRTPRPAMLEAADAILVTPPIGATLVETAAEAAAGPAPTGKGTPPREAQLRDHLRGLSMVVLDEADLLLGSFRADVDKLVAAARRLGKHNGGQPQFVFAAATMMDGKSRALGRWFNKTLRFARHITSPRLHTASKSLTVNTITIDTKSLHRQADDTGQPFEVLLADARHVALMKALAVGPHRKLQSSLRVPEKTLVFTNSAMSAEAAHVFLEAEAPDIACAVLHKQVPYATREMVHVEFVSPEGDVDVLIGTDMAGRGLDTVEVGHVIQLECAVDLASYLHRIGRTARAGGAGVITNIVPTDEWNRVQALVQQSAGGRRDAVTESKNARHKARRQHSARRRR